MTSQPNNELIHIIYTEEDVRGMVDDFNDRFAGAAALTYDVALKRAAEWAKHIQDTAAALCNEQLESVIAFGAP